MAISAWVIPRPTAGSTAPGYSDVGCDLGVPFHSKGRGTSQSW